MLRLKVIVLPQIILVIPQVIPPYVLKKVYHNQGILVNSYCNLSALNLVNKVEVILQLPLYMLPLPQE